MTTLKTWSAFFIGAVLGVSAASWADLQFSVEPALIQPGERAKLVLRLPQADLQLPANATEEMVPEAQDESLTAIPDLELLDQDYRKVRDEYIWTYAFTSYKPGLYTLPPVAVRLGPQSFSSQRLTVTVRNPRPEGDTVPRPDAGPLSPPWSKAWLLWLGLAVLFAGLAYFFRHKLRRPARPLTPEVSPTPVEESPLEWLRKQLLILRARLDTSPEDVSAPDWWTAIVKEYAARVKKRPVRAWTTSEYSLQLREDAQLLAVADLLRQCDALKFGRHGVSPAETVKQILVWIEMTERALL